MLKFFRKIRQKLLSENKFSKYLIYAIGEIVLVVIGILIALQINNWNENRIERNLEERYISRFLEDLEEEEIYDQSFIDYNLKVNDYANKAIQYFDDSSIAMGNPSQSLIDLYQASQFNDARTTASTYKELNSSGQINLIQNLKLRSALISFYELDWINSVVFDIPNNYRESLRSTMPNAVQKAIRANCGDIYVETKNSIAVELPEKCEIEVDIEEAKIALRDLLSNETIKADLTFLIGNMEAKLALVDYVQKELNDVITEFEQF